MVGQFGNGMDVFQEVTESATGHISNIAGIVTSAVRDVARETGDWVTDLVEMPEAAARANADSSPGERGE